MQAAERELLDGDRQEFVEIGLVEDRRMRVVRDVPLGSAR